MPAFETLTDSVVDHFFRMKLDGVTVHLGRGLGGFELFPGAAVFTKEPAVAPKEMELADLFALFGRARRFELPYIYQISAEQLPGKRLMTVRMTGYHETQLAERFWREHNGNIRICPSGNGDVVTLNNTPMETGFVVPPQGVNQVVFETSFGL